VEISKSSSVQKVPYIIFGLITTVYGFGIYYVLPLALLSYKLGLILQVFFFILLGYLLGLIMFAVNAQKLMESLMLRVLLFWEAASMRVLIRNNLKAHSQKNKLTSTVFSMAIGFLIFLMVQYRLLRQQNDTQRVKQYGAYPYIAVPNTQMRIDIEGVERAIRNNPDLVEKAKLTDLSRVQQVGVKLYAV
jgi:hypothetical protein